MPASIVHQHGAVIWAAIAIGRTTNRQEAIIAAIQTGVGSLVFTVIVTIPACIVVGSPVIYAFRKQLVLRPIPWAALIGLLGVGLGAICFGWAFASDTNPEMLEMLLLFSGSSAFSYASLYGWRTRAWLIKSAP